MTRKKNKGSGSALQSAATPGASTSTSTCPIASTSTSVAPDRVPRPREVVIFCWVLDLSTSSFSITTEDNRTVDDLKNAIWKREKYALALNADADDLTLWKHYIEGDSLSESHLKDFWLRDEHPLASVEILSKAFPDVPQGYTHIIVKAPLADPPPKRRRVEDREMPQSPISSQVAPPPKQNPTHLRRQELTPAMETALQPFTQYMTYLAEGKLDRYFDPTQLEMQDADLGVTLPNGPMLLLHDLGNCPDDVRLTGIFKSETVHLFAVSGSGKTRLSLEGLCHQWGFYISCRGPSKNRAAGSSDFLVATRTMEDMSTEGPDDPNKNVNVARRAFGMLICARLFVLKHLLMKLPPGTDAKAARRRWVLVQAMPPSIRYPSDIFATVLASLRCAESRDMGDLAKSMLDDMTKIIGETIFPPNQQLFAVIDEVQEAAEYMNESFRSKSIGTDRRPVLHPFYRFLGDSDLFKGIILAGTGLSMKMVRNVVFSQSAQLLDESRNSLVFHDFGRFSNDGTDHRTYVEKYLTFASTVSDDRLMERILYWFSGRYRFTASLIELLLKHSDSRHRVLSAFVQSLTGFSLTDAIDLEEQELPLTNDIVQHIQNFHGQVSDADRLFGKLGGKDLSYIFDALMRWRIGSQSTTICIEGDVHQTIAAGIGHLTTVKPDQILDTKDKYFAYLCEPLVVLYLSSIFAQCSETTNLSWISDATFTARNSLSLGFVFEEAVLMILLQMFGGEPRALSDAFHTDQPWGSRRVILVSLKRRADGQMQSCPVSWTSGSSDRLGFKATSPAQVIEFLNNPDGKCFLFPDTHMGPDLSWFFQDWETKELILANAQDKLSETLTPEFFYTVKKREGGLVQYAPSKYPDLLEDVMNALDVKLGPAEYEPSVSNQHPQTRSVTKRVENSAPQSQRQTPKYLRIIATPNDHQRERLKAEWKGDVGVLRSECVEQYFPNVVWTTPSSVA